jgi:hypothetical protein
MKTFSFLAEARESTPKNPKTGGDEPPESREYKDVIAVNVKGDLPYREKVKENIVKYGGGVWSINDTRYPNSYYVSIKPEADVAEINNYVNELIKNKKASIIKMTPALQVGYIKDVDVELMDNVEKATDGMKEAGVDARDIAALEAMRKRYRYGLRSNKDLRAMAAKVDTTYNKRQREIKQMMQHVEELISANENKVTKEIRGILKNVDYDNKDVAVFQLSRVFTALNVMKKDGTVSEKYIDAFERQMTQAMERLGLTKESFASVMQNGVGENLMYNYVKFEHAQQKTPEQVTEEHAMLLHVLEAQRKQMPDDTFQYLKKAADEAAKTKIAVLKGIKEHPELVVDTGEKPGKPERVSAMAPDAATSTEYGIPDIRLPLGQVVTIGDLTKYKGKTKIGKKTSEEEEAMKHSVFARAEPTLFNLMGYRPKGDAASVIAAYDPLRQHMGLTAQWAAANTLGLLGSIVGKDLKDAGTGLGKFLRYELVGEPTEVNPALAQAESWLRNKFDVNKIMGNAKAASGEDTDKAVSRFEKRLSENAAADGGTAPGGDGMNVPGMIGGAGDPLPPTKDAAGSGDNWSPRKKKKDDEQKPSVRLSERVMGFDEFLNALYGDK